MGHRWGDTVTVKSLKNQMLISDKSFVALRFLSRLKGWIGKRRTEPGEGLLFPDCRSVHMWWMSIPIDIVFLAHAGGNRWRVTSAHARVRPWKVLPLNDFKASETLELPVGTIERCNVEAGDELCIDSPS